MTDRTEGREMRGSSKKGSMQTMLVRLGVAASVVALGVWILKGDTWKVRPMVDERLVGREFEVDLQVTDDHFKELVGKAKEDLKVEHSIIRFSEPLAFTQIGETVDGTGYWAITLDDQSEAYAGRFSFRATLLRGYTGGPPGSATELFVRVEEGSTRLQEKIVTPKAPPGARAILPGQIVVRHVNEGELGRLDDKYVIDLPKTKDISLGFLPRQDDYAYKLSMSAHGEAVRLRGDGKGGYQFDATRAATYELRVKGGASAREVPDGYRFCVRWGKSQLAAGELFVNRINWKVASPAGVSEKTQH